ncbi:MAG: class I SAM-dependent methyltransferase, partial [Pseudomonadota bacterium]
VDINPATHLDRERLRTAQVDQGDPASWAAFLEKTSGAPFDLIIDDGSHRPDHQQVSLDVLWPHLAPGGIFIVEDLMDNGRGDGASAQSRHRADEVVSTRRLLKGLAETGQLEGPHALSDPERLAAETASVTFHAPVISAPAPRLLRQIVTDTLRGRPVQLGRHVSYLEGSERVAILRKTA